MSKLSGSVRQVSIDILLTENIDAMGMTGIQATLQVVFAFLNELKRKEESRSAHLHALYEEVQQMQEKELSNLTTSDTESTAITLARRLCLLTEKSEANICDLW